MKALFWRTKVGDGVPASCEIDGCPVYVIFPVWVYDEPRPIVRTAAIIFQQPKGHYEGIRYVRVDIGQYVFHGQY